MSTMTHSFSFSHQMIGQNNIQIYNYLLYEFKNENISDTYPEAIKTATLHEIIFQIKSHKKV